MLFATLIGALMFAEAVDYTTMPGDLEDLITNLNLSPIMVVTAIRAVYVISGTAMHLLVLSSLIPHVPTDALPWRVTFQGGAVRRRPGIRLARPSWRGGG